MAKLTVYSGSYTDDDSGIGVDLDNSSSNDLTSSTLTLIESSPSYTIQPGMSSPFLPPTTKATMEKRFDVAPSIRFASDGIVERIRPATMRNSENGDFILCQTNRGSYIAYRTPVVPQWVTRLVEEIEFREQ